MNIDFWVYENIPTNHARIHRGSCRYCNHGRGTHNHPGQGPTSWWHPMGNPDGFSSYAQAYAMAEETGKPWRDCAVCHPSL